MILGSNIIYKCNKCENLISRRSLKSGNTFGAKLFSDGKQIAPMLPEFPTLVKCDKCGHFLWLNKLEVVNKLEATDNFGVNKLLGIIDNLEEENPTNDNPSLAMFLSINEYFEAIQAKAFSNEEEERYIRIHLWWAYNDKVRIGKDQFLSGVDEKRWRENVKQLIPLLNIDNIDNMIMQAELYRNLGDFEKSLAIINNINNEGLDWIREIFTLQCKKKNRKVFELIQD